MADKPGGSGYSIVQYWKHGKGALKIRWGTPGDWTRCERHLRDKVGAARAKRMCAQWHIDMNGYATGDRRNK